MLAHDQIETAGPDEFQPSDSFAPNPRRRPPWLPTSPPPVQPIAVEAPPVMPPTTSASPRLTASAPHLHSRCLTDVTRPPAAMTPLAGEADRISSLLLCHPQSLRCLTAPVNHERRSARSPSSSAIVRLQPVSRPGHLTGARPAPAIMTLDDRLQAGTPLCRSHHLRADTPLRRPRRLQAPQPAVRLLCS